MKSQNVVAWFRAVMARRRISPGIPRGIRPLSARVLPLLALGLAPALAAAPAQAGEAAQAATGVVYFVQGLPGVAVDVQLDGRTVARGVGMATVAGPFRVAAGERRVTARSGGRVVLDRRIRVAAGGSLDAVLHLPAAPSGAPVMTTYVNDLTAVPADKGAVRVAHTAAVGPADIRVNGKVLFANVANGESLDVVVPAATYRVEIVPAGATGPRILGPLPLPVAARSLTRVFAVGTPATKTMNVAVHVIRLPSTGTGKPTRIDTGTGGQAAATTTGGSGTTTGGSGVTAMAGLAGLLVATTLLAAAVHRRKVVRR